MVPAQASWGRALRMVEADMKCPICKKEVAMTDQWMPFCSERCKLIDLGNWSDEKYVISTPIVPSYQVSPGEEADDDE
jgi:uncharacterized protein